MVYVSTSADESCNLPMVEANACGIPAVVFDCRGDYSDHCEYIKYGIVVNIEKQSKVSKAEMRRFQMAINWINWYHSCTRHLGINCLLPKIPKTKFYDFPMSLAEWHKRTKYKFIDKMNLRTWHKGALHYCFGVGK